MLGHPVILLDQETGINFKEDKLTRTDSMKNEKGRESFTSEIVQHDCSLDSEPAWGCSRKECCDLLVMSAISFGWEHRVRMPMIDILVQTFYFQLGSGLGGNPNSCLPQFRVKPVWFNLALPIVSFGAQASYFSMSEFHLAFVNCFLWFSLLFRAGMAVAHPKLWRI